MYFRDAIRSLNAQNAACKRPSWKGYIYRNETTGAGGTGDDLADGAYQLRFKYSDGADVPMLINSVGTDDIVVRKKGGSGADADDVGVYKGTTGTTAAVALVDYCPLTTFLLNAILDADDFFVGTKDDFDAASSGTNEF